MNDHTNYLHEELVQLIASYLDDVGPIRTVCATWCRWVKRIFFKLNIVPSDNIKNIIERLKQHPGPLKIQFNKTNPLLALKICNAGLHTVSSLRQLIVDFKWQDPFSIEDPNATPPLNVFLRYSELNYSTLANFTQLEYLSAPQLSSAVILQLPNLTSLHLTNSGTFEISTLLTLTKLRELSLESCQELTIGPGEIPTNTNLTRLKVARTTVLDPSFLNQLVNLKDLHLHYFNMTSPYNFIVPMTSLESLTLNGWSEPAAVASIALNTNLTRIEISGGFAIENYADNNFLDEWSRLTKLEILKLTHFALYNSVPAEKCNFFTNLTLLQEFHALAAIDQVADLIQYLQPNRLTCLVLGQNENQMTEEDLTQREGKVSISHLCNLQSLQVRWIQPKITDLGHLTQLTSLDFWNINQISPKDFITDLTSLKNLEVELYAFPFNWKRLRNLTNLETINVQTMEHSNIHVISTLTKLHHLQIQEDECGRYLGPLSNLTRLKIRTCAGSEEFRQYIPGLTNLRELYLEHNNPSVLETLTALQHLTYLYSSSAHLDTWQWYSALTQLRVLRPSNTLINDDELIDIAEWSDNLSYLEALIHH